MKWIISTVAFTAFLACSCVSALDAQLSEEEGDPRLGFISIDNSGTTSLTFNATSIQNAVILGLFLFALGFLVLPLFGLSLGSLFGKDEGGNTGYGEYEQPGYQAGYEQPSSGYNTFAKRSLDFGVPILEALISNYKKYEEE